MKVADAYMDPLTGNRFCFHKEEEVVIFFFQHLPRDFI